MGRARSRRRRGKTGGVGSSRSKSKSNKSKSTGGSRGRSSNTRGGQSKANRNQNKKARRTVSSVKKAVGRAAKTAGNIAKHIGRGAVSYAANHPGVSSYNRKTRDMSKLSPQSRRRYERLSAKTGRDYSKRIPTMRINLSADRLAQFGGFADSGWYKGITNRFPGIRNLQINKQLYSNPQKRGWHSSQRTGRGQGSTNNQRELAERVARSSHPEFIHSRREAAGLPSLRTEPKPLPRSGPQQDWLGSLYSSHNISGGKLDQEARDYWSNEAKTKGRDAVMQSIIGTSKAQGTYGGRKKPQRINTGSRRRGGGGTLGAAALSAGIGLLGSVTKARRAKQHHRQQAAAAQKSYDLQAKGMKRRQGMLAKTIAATMAARGM